MLGNIVGSNTGILQISWQVNIVYKILRFEISQLTKKQLLFLHQITHQETSISTSNTHLHKLASDFFHVESEAKFFTRLSELMNENKPIFKYSLID